MINIKKREATIKKMKEAYIKICSVKDCNNITISDVCKEANLYRSTFYNYYHHIGELQDSIEEEIIGSLLTSAGDFSIFRLEVLVKSPKHLLQRYEMIMQILYDNKAAVLALMAPKSGASFERKYREAIKKSILDALKTNKIESNQTIDYYLDYMSSGIASAQYSWLKNGAMSLEEFSLLLNKLNVSIITTLIHTADTPA